MPRAREIVKRVLGSRFTIPIVGGAAYLVVFGPPHTSETAAALVGTVTGFCFAALSIRPMVKRTTKRVTEEKFKALVAGRAMCELPPGCVFGLHINEKGEHYEVALECRPELASAPDVAHVLRDTADSLEKGYRRDQATLN